MPRKKLQNKRAVEADPKYNSVLVSRFTNGLMLDGKKSLARRMFYDAMAVVEEKLSEE
ncbi:30S ribosomal protein S7, partial [Desulfobulbus sp. N3]|nr:30S ribosomal protein S7 [Desulfobulbus sp. N3]